MMEIRLKFTDSLTDEKNRKYVWDLLCKCDKEFTPPLSSREGPKQATLKGTVVNTDTLPKQYFDQISKQCFILAFNQDDLLIGFMTFINNYVCESLRAIGKSNYVSTVCVEPKMRRLGVLKKLYTYIEEELPTDYRSNYISTRTWSTNTGHIRVLESRSYYLVESLVDHRGPGIDTVYYAKRLYDSKYTA